MIARKRVRIGFIGVGKMGQCAHLRNYASLDECTVTAIAELKPELARRVADHYKVPRVFFDFREMLATEELDGIVASQPFTTHKNLIAQLARLGVPVFIEKPLARSVEAGEAILKALSDNPAAKLMIGYHKRSDPATIRARQEIESLKSSGELGRLTYIRLTMPFGNWVGKGFDELITTEEVMPESAQDNPDPTLEPACAQQYEAFINYYIHQLNLMRHLLGEAYTITYADPSGVMLAGQSESGVACTLELSPYKTTSDWQESALITFERGYVCLELPAPLVEGQAGRVEIFKDSGRGAAPKVIHPEIPQVGAMRQQAINFISFIRNEARSNNNDAPLCTAAEALEDLKTAREYLQLLNSNPFPLA